MKIWFDILTPKQLLFFEPWIKKLSRNNQVICTSRQYDEVSNLARIRKIRLINIGKHGGKERSDKLKASIERIRNLFGIISKEKPDVLISFCSPEASRIAFGLGIHHIGFSDSPHATYVMKLSVPYLSKLLIPWIIPKEEFRIFGIEKKDIIQYHAIDAFITVNRKAEKIQKSPFLKKDRLNILIRMVEDQASYAGDNKSVEIIQKILERYREDNVVVLTRYHSQKEFLKKRFGNKIRLLVMSFDGKSLLQETSLFIGSGGTMTAEAALMGVPTVSYSGVPNLVEDYLVKMKLIQRETMPQNFIAKTEKALEEKSKIMARAKKISNEMEDPFNKLNLVLDQIKKTLVKKESVIKG